MRIDPITGILKISAPHQIKEKQIQDFILTKQNWIKQKQQDLQKRQTKKEPTYTTGEKHVILGKKYTLHLLFSRGKTRIEIRGNYIHLYTKPDTSVQQRKKTLENLYRTMLEAQIPKLVAQWTDIIGIAPAEVRIKKMKTRWGSCNPPAKRIWLNLSLAQYPPECLTYVFVHEMVHFLVKGHGPNFYHFMDRFLPKWPQYKTLLNSY